MLDITKLPTLDIEDADIIRRVANRARLARKAAGISQERLGEMLGVTFQQIQKYEKGVNRIGPEKLTRLARATGRTIAWFYEDVPLGKAMPADTDLVGRLARDPGFAELAECWLRLSPSARLTAMQTTRLLAELTAPAEQGRAA
jgi:transcriptional regulator with XRE-family HTH domain